MHALIYTDRYYKHIRFLTLPFTVTFRFLIVLINILWPLSLKENTEKNVFPSLANALNYDLIIIFIEKYQVPPSKYLGI